MYFQIRKLVLWSTMPLPPRVVDFEPGKVNVISGASKTGKSAVIPIIDYCLGSGKCAIPVGVIRDSCSWFGIVVDTIEGQKLLARKAPGAQKSSGEMFVLQGSALEIPHSIEVKNDNVDSVRQMLDRLAGLTFLGFDPGGESGFSHRPSFRDLMAFTFQPQNIVANPEVLFFKADTTEHREKLKTIFPYVLRAVTPEVMNARYELDLKLREYKRGQLELSKIRAATDHWKNEASVWLRQAMEFGLINIGDLPTEWPDLIELMRRAVEVKPELPETTLDGIEGTLSRLEKLQSWDTELAESLAERRQRLIELNRLKESSDAYGQALRTQKDRLSLSTWIRERLADPPEEALFSRRLSPKDSVDQLCDALQGIELQLRSLPQLHGNLDREIVTQRSEASEILGRLAEVRTELKTLEGTNQKARDVAFRAQAIQRFIGRMEQALALYERSDDSSPLYATLSDLFSEITELRRVVQEGDIRRRLNNVLDNIQTVTGTIIPKLDAEWENAAVRLVPEELTLKVIRDQRDDYLFEIGSGANWLAYHIAVTLALQRFFLSIPGHEVPGLLIYDQPSQVYFPSRVAKLNSDGEPSDPQLQDQDVAAVRMVFAELGRTVGRAKGLLQVIVLDHAGDEVWGNLENVRLVEEWRDGLKLVPNSWQPAELDSLL